MGTATGVLALTSLPYVANNASLVRNTGRQIAWPIIPDSYRAGAKKVVVGAAGAAAGDTTIPTDALPQDISVGEILNFGTLAPVLVTVSDASIAAGDTSFGVVALPGPIPSGTRLNFSGGTNAQVAEVDGDHAAGATALTVLPLDGTIANGATATFAGGTKQARVTVPAAADATSLTVDELQFALVEDDEAYIINSSTAGKAVKGSTTMVEVATGTYAGQIVPRAVRPAAETASMVLESTADEESKSAASTGHGCLVGGVLYENMMADAVAGDLPADYKTELAANGCTFVFEDYGDNTA